MFSCYRKDEANDPDIYCSAVAAVLSEYSKDVIDYVTDPRTGLPSSQKFLPVIAEVRQACDDKVKFVHRMSEPRRQPVPRKEIPIQSGQITYGEFLLRNTGRSGRPVGAFDVGGYLGASA